MVLCAGIIIKGMVVTMVRDRSMVKMLLPRIFRLAVQRFVFLVPAEDVPLTVQAAKSRGVNLPLKNSVRLIGLL